MTDQAIQLADPITLAVLGGLLIGELRGLRRDLLRIHSEMSDLLDALRDAEPPVRRRESSGPASGPALPPAWPGDPLPAE